VPPPARYFRKVRLRHKTSGLYLAATAELYAQEWSAQDQHAVLLKPAADDPDLDWIIQPPCGMDFTKSVGAEVVLSDNAIPSVDNVVRFYSPSRQRHLHSHGDRGAPWAPQDKTRNEVTLFAQPAFGDVNDNWQLLRAVGRVDPTGEEVTIRHFMTELYLANDGRPEVQLKSGLFAPVVWTEEDPAQNGQWLLEPQVDTAVPVTPDIVAQYKNAGREVILHTLTEADEWMEGLKSAYQPFRAALPMPDFGGLSQPIQNTFAQLDRYLADLHDVDSIEGYEHKVAVFRDAVEQAFSKGSLIDPASSDFQFVLSLLKSNAREAAYVFMRLTGMEIDSADESAVMALLKLELFQRYGDGLPQEPWRKTLDAAENLRKNLEGKIAEYEQQLAVVLKSSHDLFERSKDNQAQILEDGKRELERIRDSFRAEKISDAPNHYWTEKRQRHLRMVRLLGVAFGGSIFATVIIIIRAMFTILPSYRSEAPNAADFFVHFTLPVAAVVSLLIWAIKAISRNLVSQIHLAADANERETMLLTFRALLQDKDRPLTDEEKKIIVSIAFRPGGSGLGDEPSGPTWLWEAWLKKEK
jgi:Family of unknown function (DUF6161)